MTLLPGTRVVIISKRRNINPRWIGAHGTIVEDHRDGFALIELDNNRGRLIAHLSEFRLLSPLECLAEVLDEGP